jgi:hypothetical protein
MAAGAARHGARKGAHRTTNALQALGVAGGGLLAVTVMTMLAGGPAEPDIDPTEVSTSTSRSEELPAGFRGTGSAVTGVGPVSSGSARVTSAPGAVSPRRPAPAPTDTGAARVGSGPASSPRTTPIPTTPRPTHTPRGRTVPVKPGHPVTPTPRPAPSATPTVPVDPGVPSPPDGASPTPTPTG